MRDDVGEAIGGEEERREETLVKLLFAFDTLDDQVGMGR